MSELINTHDNRATIRWKLLTGVSALALTAYISSGNAARAEDADHPLVWIELGGQVEQMEGLDAPFTAPFMTAITPTPDVYGRDIFNSVQSPPRFAFGEEGKITFQPEDSNWTFSAGIRYGRSHRNSYLHNQGPIQYGYKYNKINHTFYANRTYLGMYAAPFAEEQTRTSERHAILDFQAGKDVGIGAFGPQGSSNIGLGVRLAQFSENSTVVAYAVPQIGIAYKPQGTFVSRPVPTFYAYTMRAHADRSFRGIGPSLGWNASAALAGNTQDGEITLDWGVDAALLFGRQTAKTSHDTQDHHLTQHVCYRYKKGVCVVFTSGYPQVYPTKTHHSTRSRRVTVPNFGGFVGLSYRYSDAKISFGYRYDTFLSAMDTGIDAAKKSNLTFNGPYASISIGIGD